MEDEKYKVPMASLELRGYLLVRRIKTSNVVIPEKLVQTALKISHELIGGNHRGINRSYREAKS